MAAQPDISSILAALAAQRPTSTSAPPTAQLPSQPPVPGLPQGYSAAIPTATPPTGMPYALPQPSNSGSLDLSSIKPVSTGSVSLADAIAKAHKFAAEKGVSYDSTRNNSGNMRDDPRLASRSYRRSRSRSRSPNRRESYRDNYNPYRDERRDDARRSGFGRERSRSPVGRNRETFSPGRSYGGRKSPDDNSEMIVIDSALVGLVIGRQGENLRRIEQESGTRIQFIQGPESAGPQRQCRITGNPRARLEAKREINRIIEENGGNPARDTNRAAAAASATPAPSTARGAPKANNQPALREGENSVQIMVPDRTVGLIIGRGGETIRDLQERSGCHVNIVGENKSVNGLRPVNLIGTPQAAARAKELILEIVDSDTRIPQAQREAGRSGIDPLGEMPGGSNKISDTIVVPSEAVGMIIGKGGETIKDMQNTTNCKINVSQGSGADIEREIGLVGTRSAIEDAKKAIWEKVDAVREKNGGAGGRQGAKRDHDNNYGERYSQPQQPYGQQATAQSLPQSGLQSAPATTGDQTVADPYAAWGGYQNYVTMWYASLAQQQQAQQGQAPGQSDQQRPGGQ